MKARLSIITLLLLTTNVLAGGTLHRGNMSEPGSLDPHLVRDVYEMNIVMDLFLGLATYSADGKTIPGAADSWVVSDDGLTYTFTMKPGLEWSDGAPLTARDFEYSFRRLFDPKIASPIAYIFFLIENSFEVYSGSLEKDSLGVQALDAHTLEIRLTEPAVYFPQLLTHVSASAVPRHIIETYGKGWTQPDKIVTSGAFQLSEWRPQDKITLQKNPRFYAAETVALDQVIYYPLSDNETALKMFRAGELDVNWGFATSKYEWLQENLEDEVRIYPQLALFYIVINLQKPPLSDVRVRNALSMAIDRELMIDKLVRTGNPAAYSLVLPGTENYPQVGEAGFSKLSMEQRRIKAKSLLADAGYTEKNPLEVTIQYTTARDQKNLPIVIAAMWREIGVRTSFSMSEFKVMLDDIQLGNFDLFPTSWIGDYNDPTTFTMMLLPHSVANYGKFRNDKYQQLHEEAAFKQDIDARAALIRQAELIAMNEQAIIPIYFNVSRYLVSQRVTGWKDNLMNFHPSRYLDLN